jgi:NAD(P)-dependent dehydrogenase (short-subunit alcohol dehydrogenase family)
MVRAMTSTTSTTSTILDTFRPGLFEGHAVAITGGGSGIGLVTAKRFAELGARVSICGRRSEMLDAAKQAIEEAARAKGFAHAVVVSTADVKKPETLAAWRDATLQAFDNKVDIVIANAGANFLAPAASITPNGFATVVGTVLLGTWNTIHAWYPHLSERASSNDLARTGGANIVLMAATNGYTASPLMAHSGEGKAGMLNLAQTLAAEWSPQGIRVNAVAPGPVDTEGANARLWAEPAARKRVESTVPLGRMGTAEDCAAAVLFLCSPAGAFITGTTLTVDGGNFLKPLPNLL